MLVAMLTNVKLVPVCRRNEMLWRARARLSDERQLMPIVLPTKNVSPPLGEIAPTVGGVGLMKLNPFVSLLCAAPFKTVTSTAPVEVVGSVVARSVFGLTKVVAR